MLLTAAGSPFASIIDPHARFHLIPPNRLARIRGLALLDLLIAPCLGPQQQLEVLEAISFSGRHYSLLRISKIAQASPIVSCQLRPRQIIQPIRPKDASYYHKIRALVVTERSGVAKAWSGA
jgi:hypothetical protein